MIPELREIVGERRLKLMARLSPQQVAELKARLRQQLEEALPTISPEAAAFGADRLLSAGVLDLPHVVGSHIVYVTWLGYTRYNNAQIRYFLWMYAQNPQVIHNLDLAASNVSSGKQQARYVYRPIQVAQVLEWAYQTGSYRKKHHGYRIRTTRPRANGFGRQSSVMSALRATEAQKQSK